VRFHLLLVAYNQRVTQLATELKVTRGRKLRTDGTVVETNIHSPSDSRLLADSVRVIGRTLQRAKQVLTGQTDLGAQVFRNRTRSARKTARQVQRSVTRQKKAAKQAYRKLVQITQQRVSQAQQVLEALAEHPEPQAQGLKETLETCLPRAEQVSDQTVRRVFQDEKVPAAEKIVSIFEPHTAIIRRGKAGKPVEYGRKVWLDEVEGGIVTRWEVLKGNPSDRDQWIPSLDAHGSRLSRPVLTGVFSPQTMKPKPNAERSKGSCFPNQVRNRSNAASMRNSPGFAAFADGKPASKVASLCSNVVTILTDVSITEKLVSNVGSVGA
jgi:IS5 family transposase